ncbi:MAG: heterodisulfide reductase subunit A-like protein [bacterium]
MDKTGLLLCVCQGTCPSFEKMNIFEVLNALRKEEKIDFVSLHPQLCSDDGDEFLKVLLSGGKVDKIIIAGCDPTMQKKMFRYAFEEVGFSPDKLIPVDIRNMNTEQVISAIKSLI